MGKRELPIVGLVRASYELGMNICTTTKFFFSDFSAHFLQATINTFLPSDF